MFARLLVFYLLLSPIGSLASLYEYDPDWDSVQVGEHLMVFSVYRGNYEWVRFNLSLVNLGGAMVLEDMDWSYFDAEVYNMDGEFLGYVRGKDHQDYYLFFLAPYGRHVRSWRWNMQVVKDDVWTVLDSGEYQIVGVFRGVDGEIRTSMFEFHLGSQGSSGGYVGPNKKDRVLRRIEFGFMRASGGVLFMGFFEDRFLVWLRGVSGWGLDWGRNRTILWMATVALSILMLGLTQFSGFLYDVFWV
jgi:hypothetical protein